MAEVADVETKIVDFRIIRQKEKELHNEANPTSFQSNDIRISRLSHQIV
jgi:hypothetical protein